MSETNTEQPARTTITSRSKLEVKGCWPESTVLVDDLPTLHPTTPLATGYLWSQVWMGCLVRGDASEPVVLKIFQGSMFPQKLELTHPIDPKSLAHNEAEAFNAMIALQGNVVPKSYGFFKSLVDGVEDVIIHVMEFINAPTLDQLEYPQFPHPTVKLEHMLGALDLIHDCDVCHQDLSPHNILITPTSRVVFIDFAMSKISQDTLSKYADVRDLLYIVPLNMDKSSKLGTGSMEEMPLILRKKRAPRPEVNVSELWKRPLPPNLTWTCAR
ncbi:kinase-like domain-containing protein [Flagelloscypha sp. PMI_526]|nr:kinase-like domain-containing protein [Flagelloscypha sp. PMI_526]